MADTSVHIAAGIAIAHWTHNPAAAVVAASLSHAALDYLPMFYPRKGEPIDAEQKFHYAIQFFIVATLAFYLSLCATAWTLIVIVAANLPDLVERMYRIFKPHPFLWFHGGWFPRFLAPVMQPGNSPLQTSAYEIAIVFLAIAGR